MHEYCCHVCGHSWPVGPVVPTSCPKCRTEHDYSHVKPGERKGCGLDGNIQRSGRVILVGTLASWDEPKGLDDQIWCINKGYKHQPNLDRLYLMDPMNIYVNVWGEGFIEEVNALGVPVIVRESRPYLDNCVEFNWQDSFDNFNISFFGATVANAIAHAIEENVAEIVMHRMYIKGESELYLHQRAPVSFWVGQAISHGIQVTVDDDCYLAQKILDAIAGELSRPHAPLPEPNMGDIVVHEYDRQEARKAAREAQDDVRESIPPRAAPDRLGRPEETLPGSDGHHYWCGGNDRV